LAGAILSVSTLALSAAEAHIYPTPEAAVAALDEAVSTTNRSAFAKLFGDPIHLLANPDQVQGDAELAEFSSAFNTTNRLVPESGGRMTLEIGERLWPFPIPLTRVATGWQFDTKAGIEELLNRRIGRNELDVLRVMREYVQSQREYASRDRDGDEVLEYAQKISSSPGHTDGLYWPPELNGEISPLGPAFVRAQEEGYLLHSGEENGAPQPFHGYLFKILTGQGKYAPGGQYNYVINGNMIGGFAMLAWPAAYGDSGIMSFIVNQQGRVYQRDLGPDTGEAARKIETYDPDTSWRLSAD
jgi:hypothetical protein